MCPGIVRSGQDVSHRRAEDLGLPGETDEHSCKQSDMGSISVKCILNTYLITLVYFVTCILQVWKNKM